MTISTDITAGLLATMQVIIICTNGMVIVLLLLRKALRTVPNLYIVSVSVADILVGCFVASSAIIKVLNVEMHQSLCLFLTYAELFSFTAESMFILALSIDRYRSVCKSATYHPTLVSTLKITLTVWAVSAIYAVRVVLQFFTYNHNEDHHGSGNMSSTHASTCNSFVDPSHSDTYFRIADFFLLIVIPGITLTILYYKITNSLKIVPSCMPTIKTLRRKATIKMLIVCAFTYLSTRLMIYVCDFTHEILAAVDPGGHEEGHHGVEHSALEYAQVFFVLINSIANPILYGYFNKNFSREWHIIWLNVKQFCGRTNRVGTSPKEETKDKENKNIKDKTYSDIFTTQSLVRS